jgi:hypothetical protein
LEGNSRELDEQLSQHLARRTEENYNKTSITIAGSSVGIVTGYGLDDGEVGVRVLVGSRIFSSPRRGAHPGSYPVGTEW